MAKLSRFGNFGALLTFLSIELLAIVSFNLGGISSIFQIAAFIIAAFGIFVTFKKFKNKDELISLLYVAIPVLILAALVSFGKFNSGESPLVNIATFLGLIGAFALGLANRRNKSFNIGTALIFIGGGLALLVIFGMIYTWINYGFMYSLRYQDTPNYYYDGVVFNITEETGWLYGFKFMETTIRYTGLFGVVLASFLGVLLFLSPQKDTRTFVIFGVYGFIGLLSLLTIPNFKALLYLIPIAVVMGYLKFLYHPKVKDETKANVRKIVNKTAIIGFIVLVIFFFLCFLNAAGFITDFVAGNWFFNKLFNNGRIMQPINLVLNQSLSEPNLFGFDRNPSYYYTNLAIYTNTKFFEFETVKEGGLFALFALVFLLVTSIGSIQRYSKKSKDKEPDKALLIAFLLAILLYSTFSHDSFNLIHSSETYTSFYRNTPVLIALFLVGYSFYPELKKDAVPLFEVEEEKTDEANVEQTNYVDEYTFTVEEEKEDE